MSFSCAITRALSPNTGARQKKLAGSRDEFALNRDRDGGGIAQCGGLSRSIFRPAASETPRKAGRRMENLAISSHYGNHKMART